MLWKPAVQVLHTRMCGDSAKHEMLRTHVHTLQQGVQWQAAKRVCRPARSVQPYEGFVWRRMRGGWKDLVC